MKKGLILLTAGAGSLGLPRAVFNDSSTIDSIISVGRDITEQKELEDQLTASEQKYHRLFEEAKDGIALAEVETGIIIDCNLALCTMVEREKSEIIGQPQSLLHPPKPTGEQYSESFAEHRKSSDGQEIDTQVISKRGEIKDVVIKANFLTIDGKQVMQGFFHEITEEKRARQEVVSLAKFPSENPSPVLRVDNNGIIIYANQASDIFLSSWKRKVGEPLPEQLKALTITCLEDGNSSQIEIPYKDRTYLTLFVPVLDLGYVNLYARDISDRKEMEIRLHELATTDELTGVNNRRQFIHLSRRELKRAQRYGSTPTLLMLDIDYFKKVNDTYGHAAGDKALKELSACAKSIFREVDIFGRVGGEEFAVLLPEIDSQAAVGVAERLRSAIEKMNIQISEGSINITVSIGISSLKSTTDTIDTLLQQADTALYTAKKAGRNQIKLYSK